MIDCFDVAVQQESVQGRSVFMWFTSCLLQEDHNDPFWPLHVSIPSLVYKIHDAEIQGDRGRWGGGGLESEEGEMYIVTALYN